MKRILISSLVLAALAGCAAGDISDPTAGDSSGSVQASSGSASGAASGLSLGSASGSVAGSGRAATGSSSGATAGSFTGSMNGQAGSSGMGGAGCMLPSNVQSFLEASCQGCHGATPSGGAPMSLVTYGDLTRPSVTQPSKAVGTVCVARMASTTAPMPPQGSPAPSAQAASSFENWVVAGMPCANGGSSGASGSTTGASGATTGTSGDTTGMSGSTAGDLSGSTGASGGTAGASGASGTSGISGNAGSSGSSSGAAGQNFNTPMQCSSGKTYKSGTGPTMRPGDQCPSCHGNFTGGTVYPTAHEPTLCDGANVTGATVVITDAKGAVTTLTVNNVGNFYTSAAIAKPFHAKVLYKGVERDMMAAQTSGDCNSCHSEQGVNGAPGRIVLP